MGYRLRWERAGGDLVGKSLLKASDGRTFAVSSPYCFAHVAGHDTLLVWYSLVRPSCGDPTYLDAIQFRMFDLRTLRPYDSDAAAAALLAEHLPFAAHADEIASWSVPQSIPAGVTKLEPPAAFRGLGELLILADPAAGDRTVSGPDLRLWVIDCRTGQIDVIPQDWFNCGDYDFGYQWVTRMARLPSGQVVGEGIRLGIFQLDASLRGIDEWLAQDVFYQPDPGVS